MNPAYSYEQLVERMVRARVRLEAMKKQCGHGCLSGLDPDAACSCGNVAYNREIDRALAELKL